MVRILFVAISATIIKEKFRLISWIRLPFGWISRNQIVGLIVVNLADFLVHESFKDIIGRFQHFDVTTEIFLEDNQLALTRIGLIEFKFIIKNLRIGLTESIDGLLNVTNHKAIISSSQQFQHPLLSMVGVLVLIDHHLMVLILIKTPHFWIIF